MKTLIPLLATSLLAAAAPSAGDGLSVRYADLSGRVSLTVSHDIEVIRQPPIRASRSFSFDLSLAAAGTSGIEVTVEQARGRYTAHEMTERLTTRHLTGKTFPVTVEQGGRAVESAASTEEVSIDLGPVTTPGLSIAAVLTDALPRLPADAVKVGTTWSSERPVRSLEGWAWTTGTLTSRHQVTDIDNKNGHTVVHVSTDAAAKLAAGGKAQYHGDLKRTLKWTFDAEAGRVLTVLLEQETTGVSEVPQGEISLRQITRVELGPATAS